MHTTSPVYGSGQSSIALAQRAFAATVPIAQPLTRFQRAYFWAYIASLVICWLWIKSIPYVLPFFVLFGLLAAAPRRGVMLRRLLWLGMAFVFFVAVSILFNRDFVMQNAGLAFITYSSWLIPLVVPARYLANDRLSVRIAKTLVVVIAVEAVIGIVQALYGYQTVGSFDVANGDRVEGTIHLALAPSMTASNRIFAANMVFALLFLLPHIYSGRLKGRVWLALGLVSLVLGSVMHILLLLLIAAGCALVYFRPWGISLRKRGLAILFAMIFVFVLTSLLLPSNLSLVRRHYENIRAQDNAKAVFTLRVIQDAPKEYPQLPFIGIGPGQFAGLGGIIATGLYFGGPESPQTLPFVRQVTTPALDTYMMDLWLALTQINRPTGSTLKPFSSWLGLYTEFGGVGVLLVLLALAGILISTRRLARSHLQRVEAFAFGTGAILLFLLGAQLHYWETSQLILPGVMGLKVMYAHLLAAPAGSLRLMPEQREISQ